jgi:hypothetical protein
MYHHVLLRSELSMLVLLLLLIFVKGISLCPLLPLLLLTYRCLWLGLQYHRNVLFLQRHL